MSELVSSCSRHSTEITKKPFLRWGPKEERKRGRWQLARHRKEAVARVQALELRMWRGNQPHLPGACGWEGRQINKMKQNKKAITKQQKYCLNWDWSKQRNSEVSLGEAMSSEESYLRWGFKNDKFSRQRWKGHGSPKEYCSQFQYHQCGGSRGYGGRGEAR